MWRTNWFNFDSYGEEVQINPFDLFCKTSSAQTFQNDRHEINLAVASFAYMPPFSLQLQTYENLLLFVEKLKKKITAFENNFIRRHIFPNCCVIITTNLNENIAIWKSYEVFPETINILPASMVVLLLLSNEKSLHFFPALQYFKTNESLLLPLLLFYLINVVTWWRWRLHKTKRRWDSIVYKQAHHINRHNIFLWLKTRTLIR